MVVTLSRRGRRRLLARLLTVSVTVVLGLAFVVAWVRVVQTLLKPPDHKPPTGKVTSVVWGGRVFTTSGQLRAFFEARGLSYSRWAKAHPYAFTGRVAPAAAAATVASRPAHAKSTPKTASSTKPAAAKTVTVAVGDRGSSPEVAPHRSGVRSVLASAVTVLLVLAAAALALLATVVAPLVPRLARGFHLDIEQRVTVFAAGLAILLGLFIAHLMS